MLAVVAAWLALAGCGRGEVHVPTGNKVTVDGFEWRVVGVDWHSDDVAGAVNQLNGLPDPGYRYVFVTMVVTRTGSRPSSLNNFVFGLADGDGAGHNVDYRRYSSCVVTDQPLDFETPMKPGDTQRGKVCFELTDEPVGPGEVAVQIVRHGSDAEGGRALINTGG